MIGVWLEYETALFILYVLLGALLVVDGFTVYKIIKRKAQLKKKLLENPSYVKPEGTKITIKSIIQGEGKWYMKAVRLLDHFAFDIFHIVTIFIIVELVYNIFLISPGVQYGYPSQNQALSSYENPIYIVFDRPINEGNFRPYIFPEIPGEWKLESVNALFPYVKRKAVFYPAESMFEGKVFIYYAGLTNIFGTGDKWEYGVDSQAVKLPTSATANTDNNNVDFPTDGNLEFILDEPYGKQVELEFVIDPTITFAINKVDGNKLIVDFDGTLGQSKDYSYKLYKTPVRYSIQTGEILERGDKVLLKEGSFKTIREPLIKTIEPNGSEVKVDSKIIITFDQPMYGEMVVNNFSITPSVTGTLDTTDNYTFTYNASENMAKETKYEIKIAQGIKSMRGGYVEKDIYHTFTTIGRAKVTGFSPGGNANNVSRGSNITVYFNQEVDHASAQSKFSMSPSVAGSFSWNGNAMIFNPNNDFSYVTTYTISVGSGIKSLYGIDSNESFSSRFTTEAQYFVLNVPIYHQTIRYAC